MSRLLAGVVAAAVAVHGLAALAAEVKSGLAIGDHAGAFHVYDATGPSAGKSLCYR